MFTDVHLQYEPDLVCDGCFLPFKDSSFDLVLAAQVIEHVITPWLFASEIQRVVKNQGLVQIEAPNSYPYHGEPYDFFRFTYTGLRSLFRSCDLIFAEIPEGNFSMIGVTILNALTSTTKKKEIKYILIIICKIGFFWLRYLDISKLPDKRNISMPKGYALTFLKDGIDRSDQEILNCFYKLKD